MQSEWYESRRYHAARRCWRMHNDGRRPPQETFKTWPLWWENRYGDGQTFHAYVEQKRKERAR